MAEHSSDPTSPAVGVVHHETITWPTGAVRLQANMAVPDHARGLVLMVHGCHPGAASPRDHRLAALLHEAGLATVMTDLLTSDEDHGEHARGAFRYDVDLLSTRIDDVAGYLATHRATHALPLGLLAMQEDATALVYALARLPEIARAAVLLDPHLHLAGPFLPPLPIPTLLLLTRDDAELLRYATLAVRTAPGRVQLRVFQALRGSPAVDRALGDQVAHWFRQHLPAASVPRRATLPMTTPVSPETTHAH